jgi:hypothetical protein
MILYNDGLLLTEDPLFKFHFEEYHKTDNVVLHLGYNQKNLIDKKNKKHILIQLEEPNMFLHPESHDRTKICEDYYDKILTINPEFVKNKNIILGKDLYTHVFFPFNRKYDMSTNIKTNDIIYTGNKDYFDLYERYQNKYPFIWVGNGGNRRGISYEEKINLTANSKISISHSVVDFSPIKNFINKYTNIVSNNDGIFEQHKARTIEAAFNKTIIVHYSTKFDIINEFFVEGVDYVKYREGIIDDIIGNYEKYKFLSENAYNKSISEYSTEHFYNKYIKKFCE